MTKRFATGPVLLGVLLLCACARSSATTWGYSSWYRNGGADGFMGAFEMQRNTCLSELQVQDTASIQPDSPQETQFIECMNAAGWCTQMWDCNKPGAS
jgi:hypothetical protein